MIAPPQPGDRIDHYRVDRLVARSGMASIFRGTDIRNGGLVAIKIPHPERECDVVFFDRFQREGEIGRKLDHPGIVKVLTHDDPRGRVCMVMEWVEGRPLREILDEEKKLSPERAVRIALQVCEALAYIHEQGVVHHDLKPENIMVDENDCIKLIDFGIAGEARTRWSLFGKFTKAMGTPDYASPEQIRGKRGDARSDVYSLGAILYELLTGEVPFSGSDPVVAMNQRLLTEPEPPREINPEISPQLQEIVLQALESQPDYRYATAREFACDLLHPQDVKVEERIALRNGRHAMKEGNVSWSYAALALIPILILGLLLLVARQH